MERTLGRNCSGCIIDLSKWLTDLLPIRWVNYASRHRSLFVVADAVLEEFDIAGLGFF